MSFFCETSSVDSCMFVDSFLVNFPLYMNASAARTIVVRQFDCQMHWIMTIESNDRKRKEH